jgi:hypothetical protein
MASALADVVFGSNLIRQCQNVSFANGLQTFGARTSGGIDPSALFVLNAEPRVTLETFDLATLITAFGTAGYASLASSTITVPFQERTIGATYGGDGTNNRLNGTAGTGHIVSFTGSQDAEGSSAQLEFVFRSADGTTAAVSATTDQNIAATAFVGQYAMGPVVVTLAGGSAVQLAGVVSHTVRPGVQLLTERVDGAAYTNRIFIAARDPMIEITFVDMDVLASYTPLFAALDAIVCYHRKRADGGTFVADATSAHVALSFADALMSTDSISHSQNANGTATLMVRGKALTIAAGSAISLS